MLQDNPAIHLVLTPNFYENILSLISPESCKAKIYKSSISTSLCYNQDFKTNSLKVAIAVNTFL